MRNIIVLGMHRSGTSMVAGALASSGVYVGRDEELLADQADNPLGFWERRDVVDFDEHILLQSGGSWFNPPRSLSATSSTDADMQTLMTSVIFHSSIPLQFKLKRLATSPIYSSEDWEAITRASRPRRSSCWAL